MLLDDIALHGLGAAADFAVVHREIGTVFLVAWAEVGWYTKQPECVGDCGVAITAILTDYTRIS